MTRTYLDHNATSALRPEAAEAVRGVVSEQAGNPSSLHAEGRAARSFVEGAREKVARLMGTSARDLVFTSGGSEAIAAVFRGVLDRAGGERRRVVVSAIEHSAVLASAKLAGRRGFEVEIVPCDPEGRIDPAVFASRLTEDTALAALQWANNETGVVQPVEEVGRACANAGVPFLVDAVQVAGKLLIDPRRSRADFMAISSHKIGGPQGAGALSVRDGIHLAPLVPGGAQERRRRGGTESVPAIAGFGAAAEAALATLGNETRRLMKLRVRIESRLRELCPDVAIHGDGATRLSNTVNFSLPGLTGEMLVIALDLAGFSLSTGSACASGAVEPSHVIRAMGEDDESARSALRLSMGWSTSEDDVERFLETFPGIAGQVREAIARGGRG